MMIAATMGLLRTMALQQSALRARTDFEPWHRPLAEQLRCDFANARSFELGSVSSADRSARSRDALAEEYDQLVLTGYCSRSRSTFRPTHRPAKVTYRVETVDRRSWLVRYEEQLDSTSNANVHKELVCSGIAGIGMEMPGDEQRELRSGTPPDSCRIVLLGEDASSPLIGINVCR